MKSLTEYILFPKKIPNKEYIEGKEKYENHIVVKSNETHTFLIEDADKEIPFFWVFQELQETIKKEDGDRVFLILYQNKGVYELLVSYPDDDDFVFLGRFTEDEIEAKSHNILDKINIINRNFDLKAEPIIYTNIDNEAFLSKILKFQFEKKNIVELLSKTKFIESQKNKRMPIIIFSLLLIISLLGSSLLLYSIYSTNVANKQNEVIEFKAKEISVKNKIMKTKSLIDAKLKSSQPIFDLEGKIYEK